MEGRGIVRSARLSRGVTEGLMSPEPLLGLPGRPKEVPREVESKSWEDSPRDDFILRDTMPAGGGASAEDSGVKACRLAFATAANGDTTLGLPPAAANGDSTLLSAGTPAGGCPEPLSAAPPPVLTVLGAAELSATGCSAFLLPPPNLLLGGAEVNSSLPGRLGMPAKGLLGVLLAALLGLGLLSESLGGGGALWGSSGGSAPAVLLRLATAWLAAMFKLL